MYNRCGTHSYDKYSSPVLQTLNNFGVKKGKPYIELFAIHQKPNPHTKGNGTFNNKK